jgi:3-phenylpropionate/trans-cinnamate dioxygenase ferredoxin subunit
LAKDLMRSALIACANGEVWQCDEKPNAEGSSRMDDASYIQVAKLDDVPVGKTLAVEVGGKSIVLANSADQIFAIINRCSHAEQPLACGRVRNGWIACPVHGARFELATGAVLNPPATQPIEIFPVRVINNMIEVAV